jgi:chromosome segregation ATPase
MTRRCRICLLDNREYPSPAVYKDLCLGHIDEATFHLVVSEVTRLAEELSGHEITESPIGTIAERIQSIMSERNNLKRKLDAQETELARLREATAKLANEATGFLDLASVNHHGYTNCRVLQTRIDEAKAALTSTLADHPCTVDCDELQSEQSDKCTICGVPRHSHKPYEATNVR